MSKESISGINTTMTMNSFFVLDGQLFIDLEDKTIVLNPNEGATITKGVMHKTRAPKKTIMLMVETREIVPTGD